MLHVGMPPRLIRLVLAILFNCAEPEAITLALTQIQQNARIQERLHRESTYLGAYANRLTPVASDWSLAESDGPQPMRSDLSPQQYFQNFVQPWTRDLNVRLVGGCCGITPEHIAFIKSNIASIKYD